jgi:uncharacterized repeat protein (TIGR03803 family)
MSLGTAITLGVLAVPSLARAQVSFEVLHTFAGGPDDGAQPGAALIQARDRSLYGTTASGGLNLCIFSTTPCGTVFQITPDDGTVTIRHLFNSIDGFDPEASLVEAPDGNFYGTTISNELLGEVFWMTPDGSVNYRVFHGNNDGANPVAPVVLAADGNFYGTTLFDGNIGGHPRFGTIYRFSPVDHIIVPLYRFSGPDGANPHAALVQASDGNFYGTTLKGGDFNLGTIFQMTPDGTLTVMHWFSALDGANPYSALIQASDGNFYGTTVNGGDFNRGTIFQMTPDGTLTVMHSFSGLDGANPFSALIQASDGNFYGTTLNGGDFDQGVVFQMTLDGALGVVYVFTGDSDGSHPRAGSSPGGRWQFLWNDQLGRQLGIGHCVPFEYASAINNHKARSSISASGATWPTTIGPRRSGLPSGNRHRPSGCSSSSATTTCRWPVRCAFTGRVMDGRR